MSKTFSKPITVDRTRLEALLEQARKYEMTPRDRWLQRVSFAYGNLPFDSKTTREEVEQLAIEMYGPCPD